MKEAFCLWGTDNLGRDMFSRSIFALRISLTIGLVGVFISLVLGLIIGGVSGLVGGPVDNVIQRFIEVIMSIPTIPLWMALGDGTQEWSAVQVYFAITVILSLVGWTGLARVVPDKFISTKWISSLPLRYNALNDYYHSASDSQFLELCGCELDLSCS